MKTAHVTKVLVAAAMMASLALATTVALRLPPDPAEAHSLHGHHLHASPPNPLGIAPSLSLPEPGSSLSGSGIVTHYGGGRGAKQRRGAARGRMVYTGTGSWEPTLGIDKKGNIFFQGTSFGFEPKTIVSRDGGRSWNKVTPQTHTHSLDPFIYVDPTTDRAFTADLTELGCVTVSHTDDVGSSWITSKACGLTDHQTVFAGPPALSVTAGYPNVVYMCAMDLGASSYAAFATSCLKSLDGGVGWVRTGAPAYTGDPLQHDEGTEGIAGLCDGGTGHGFADSKGIVYLPRGWCGKPYLAISKDEGATWERIKVADIGMPVQIQTACAQVCRDVAGFDHEAAVAVDPNGNVYYFWVARDLLPYLVVSRDGGKSFSKPIMVGPPGLREAWGPKIDVGGNGKIALAYLGSTNAPRSQSEDEYTGAVTWNGYITTSADASSKKPRFFTASVNPPSDPIVRGACRVGCDPQVDFIDVAIDPDGRPWTSMVDGCPAPGNVCDSVAGFIGTVIGGPRLR